MSYLTLVLRLRAKTIRAWHIALVERLAARPGTTVAVHWTPEIETPGGVDLLLRLEAMLHRLPRPGASSPVAASALQRFQALPQRPDVVLCLDAPPREGEWGVTFDGCSGETALIEALMAREPPRAAVTDADGREVAIGRIGTEYGAVLLAALEDAFARISTLIVAALDGAATAQPRAVAVRGTRGITVMRGAATAVARAARQRLYHLCFHAPHWRVGWRRAGDADLLRDMSSEGADWHVLPDDGRRFYADPFAITHAGTTTLFVEDFQHATGKAIISAVTIDEHGPAGPPRPVLETATHLSYPFVFAHDGQVWMVPERSQEGRIDLFRATAFPGGWVHEATLVDAVCASDATLLRRGAVWWLFATVRDGGGSFSDALYLWSAPQLLGPWTPHRRNPVLIDIAAARSAGAFVERGGLLYRPVQDCRRGYGAGLAIARVTRLDTEGYAQEVTSVAQGPRWRGRLHTYNRCGAFEFIDGAARAPKMPLRAMIQF